MMRFSPVWMRLCLVNLLDSAKSFRQIGHWNGFSPLSAFICSEMRPKGHWNGFSPLRMRLCLVNLLDSANSFRQMEHWNGFSPLCMRLCAVKLDRLLNAL